MVERSQRPDGPRDGAGWTPPDTPPSSYGAGLAATDRDRRRHQDTGPAPAAFGPPGWPAPAGPARGPWPGAAVPPPAGYPPGHPRPAPPPGWAAAPGWRPGPAWPQPGVPWGLPSRPYYREPHPIRARSVWAGIGSTVVWFGMFAAISWSARAYAWSTVVAAVLALLAAVALLRFGDRGVAVGVAATAGCCLGIAGIVTVVSAFSGHWLLW